VDLRTEKVLAAATMDEDEVVIRDQSETNDVDKIVWGSYYNYDYLMIEGPREERFGIRNRKQ
jgi:hypothetical protein